MDIRLRVIKESNNVGSTATARNLSVLIISHITFRDCRVPIFSDNLLEIAVSTAREYSFRYSKKTRHFP